jgi:hypothetical protein
MRFVAQTTGIDVAVQNLSRNRFSFGGDQWLSSNLAFSAVASGAAGSPGVAGAAFLDELMARQAGHLGHAMLVHPHLGVATRARESIDGGSVLFENVALVTSQMRERGDVILVTNRACGLRIPLLVEVASPATPEVDLPVRL